MTTVSAWVDFCRWAVRAHGTRLSPRRTVLFRLTAISAMATLASGTVSGCGSNLPKKPADYVAVMTSADTAAISIGPELPRDQGLLLGPNFGLSAEELSVRDEIKKSLAESLDVEPFHAADGHELLLLHLGSEQELEEGIWDEKDAPPPTAAVVVRGQARKLKEVPKSDSLIIVSVPKGAPAKLSITDQGRTQSLDLRTGNREAGSFGASPHQRLDTDYQESGRVAGRGASRKLELRLAFSSISLEPYLPGLGWAKPGRSWLLLRLDQVYSDGLSPGDSDEPYVGFFIDPAKTFSLTSADGQNTRPLKSRVLNTSRPEGSRYSVIFDVPSSFRTGGLIAAPDGPLITYRGSASLNDFYQLSRAPSCGSAGGRVVCLTWKSRPEPQVIKVALA